MNFKRRKFSLFSLSLILIITMIIVSLGVSAIAYFNTSEYVVTVTDKEVKRSGDTYKYLVFTELDNGTSKVFENTDTIFRWKFNSSDIQGQLKVGNKYTIHTQGFRIPFLSMYENIYEVK